MAYTFMDGINRLLKRVGVIQGDTGDLSSFTDSAHQVDIDVGIQSFNELIHEYYSRDMFDGEVAEGSITLVTATTSATDALAPREYALATDFERMTGDRDQRILRNETNNFVIKEHKGGYAQLKVDQIDPSDFNGQPTSWVINPIRGVLEINTNPQAGESGDVYKYLYDKRIALTATGDLFPFSDTVVDAIMPAAAQLWKRDRRKEFDDGIFNTSFNRGLSYLTQSQTKTRYGVKRG
jgi:hypothetical protein